MTTRASANASTDLEHAAPERAAVPRLLNVRELAAFLGLHEKTIYDWTARRSVPCVRLGNRIRFDLDDVLRWLSARKEG